MSELATMTPLEVWYDHIDLAKLIEDAPDKATRQRRKQMQRKAQQRVAENLFPKLVDDNMRMVDQPPLIYHQDGIDVDSVAVFFETYRQSLPHERQVLFDRYTLRDVCIKVVGVGSVGTRCYAVLFTDDADKALLLQVKEANDSVLAPHLPSKSTNKIHNGQRVVTGQRLMQPATDVFLGWSKSPVGRDFYVRQLRDMKLSVTLTRDPELMIRYGEFCGIALARAHANSGSAAAISGYLGTNATFDKALGHFALAYADQTVRDHQALVEAINDGRVPAVLEAL